MKTGIRIFSAVLALVAGAVASGSTGRYYGLWWDGAKEYFVSTDPYTSTKTVLDSIPGVKYIAAGNSAFDTDCDRYVFIGGATTGAMSYFVIDSHTGATLSQSPVGAKVDNIAYSPKDRKFYGIWWDAANAQENFVSLDPFTSEVEVIAVIPDVKWISAMNYAFDTDCNRYVFVGGATTSSMSYQVVDVHTGITTATPRTDKIDNMAYSSSDKTFYGLWWDGAKEYLAAIDPVTSEKTLLDTISGVKIIAVGTYAFDTDCNRYVFAGGASGSTLKSYVMDANTGAVLASPARTDKIDNMQ